MQQRRTPTIESVEHGAITLDHSAAGPPDGREERQGDDQGRQEYRETDQGRGARGRGGEPPPEPRETQQLELPPRIQRNTDRRERRQAATINTSDNVQPAQPVLCKGEKKVFDYAK